MMGAYQQGAGKPLPFQRQQPLLRLPLDVGTEQDAPFPVADLQHTAVVVVTASRLLWPEHRHLEPLPAPLLATPAQGREAAEVEGR